MTSEVGAVETGTPRFRVERWSRVSLSLTGFAVAFAVALFFVPVLLSSNAT